MKKRGFTLIELLAVIVILGILMVLSFPKILELVNRENEKITDAKLNLLYSATKSYLFDNNNQYPSRSGNTYCINLNDLETGGYLSYEADELDTSYVVKVSYFSDDEYQLAYTKESSCSNKGIVNTELAGLTCVINKSGYSINKKVTVSYPKSEGFKYYYSFDEGQTWNEVAKFDDNNKVYFNFKTTGSVMAKVEMEDSSLSCSAYVDQIDPTPIGTIVAFAGDKIPKGYMLADGSALAISQYRDLYEVIKNQYGNATSKSFILPNLKGKVVVGVGETYEQGQVDGEKAHSLTTNEIPSHTHTFTSDPLTLSLSGSHQHTLNISFDEIGNHTHNYLLVNSEDLIHFDDSNEENLSNNAMPGLDNEISTKAVNNHSHMFSNNTTDEDAHTHTLTINGENANTGEGLNHNNLMPYITLNYIIKYQ